MAFRVLVVIPFLVDRGKNLPLVWFLLKVRGQTLFLLRLLPGILLNGLQLRLLRCYTLLFLSWPKVSWVPPFSGLSWSQAPSSVAILTEIDGFGAQSITASLVYLYDTDQLLVVTLTYLVGLGRGGLGSRQMWKSKTSVLSNRVELLS